MSGRKNLSAGMIFAACFLGLMTTLGGSAVFVFLKKHLVAEMSSQIVICADVPAVKSFRESYPFDDVAVNDILETPPVPKIPDPFSAYLEIINAVKYSIDGYSASRNPLLKYFYCITCSLDGKIGNNIIGNGSSMIVRLPNGYLTYTFSDDYSSDSWETVREWHTWLEKRNIRLFQLLPATKMDDSITVFPVADTPLSSGYSRRMAQYMAFLAENHIPCLDAKDVLLAADSNFYSWFYRTDHHWNVFAGRLIAETVARKLNDEFQITADADAVKEKMFTSVRYPSVFQGSMAIKANAFPEDFDVLYPQKESRFHIRIPSKGIDRVGGFSDTLIAQPYLKSSHTYCCFLYGDQPLIQIENQNCSNGTRVLVLKHSQANVLCPYLACTVQFLDIIDPRHFDGSIKTFIEQTVPAVVLLCI